MVTNFDNLGNGGGGSGYTLPIATDSVLGGVMVGSGLSITSAGTLSTDVDLTDYVQNEELSGYVQTSAMSGYVETSALEDYATNESLSAYQTTQAMSGYQTTEGMSGYVETTAMSGYQTTDAMSGYQTTQAMSAYQTTEGMSAYQTTQGMSGYVQTSQLASTTGAGIVQIGSGISVQNGVISVDGGGGEEIGKATTYDWGSILLGNGIGLEVNDNDNGQSVVYGISAGENYVYGNGEGVEYDPNNSKGGGMKAALPSAYTQYDIELDSEECIMLNDGFIIVNFFAGFNEGNVAKFDCGDGRFIQIACDGNSEYRLYATSEPYIDMDAEIKFLSDNQYKSIKLIYANDNVYVYDSYDNYSIPIVVLQGVDYGDTINGIQLFDSGFSMSDTAIGTISINDTDYIKPTFEYDTDYDENRINTVGFGLRQLSMPDIM